MDDRSLTFAPPIGVGVTLAFSNVVSRQARRRKEALAAYDGAARRCSLPPPRARHDEGSELPRRAPRSLRDRARFAGLAADRRADSREFSRRGSSRRSLWRARARVPAGLLRRLAAPSAASERAGAWRARRNRRRIYV